MSARSKKSVSVCPGESQDNDIPLQWHSPLAPKRSHLKNLTHSFRTQQMQQYWVRVDSRQGTQYSIYGLSFLLVFLTFFEVRNIYRSQLLKTYLEPSFPVTLPQHNSVLLQRHQHWSCLQEYLQTYFCHSQSQKSSQVNHSAIGRPEGPSLSIRWKFY